MLTNYIRSSPELCDAEIMEYSDDGYSGKNFDRPGVEALIAAAKAGTVQCIVVKDLSRFGRDYIVVGNYITRVFPFLGVRFIAINDHFDSRRKGDIDSLDTSFKTMIYDMYSRNISAKVTNAKNRLAERGVYINPVAPYGYRKDPKDRHLLLPDPATAGTVKRIFSLVASGMSTVEVSRLLNAENVPTPSAAKAGTPSGHANWPTDNFWTAKSVNWIIRDRQYTGSTVFGKRRRTQIGVHDQPTASVDTWIIVDDRHEPLVSKELYAKAQERLGGEYKQDTKHTRNDVPLRRKVYCAVCGRAIVRRAKKNPYYCCQTPRYVPDAGCSPDRIYESEILDIVKEAVRTQARYAVEIKSILSVQRKKEASHASALKAELGRLANLQDQITMQSQKLYESYVDRKLTRKAYAEQKATLIQKREAAYQREAELKERLAIAEKQIEPAVEKYCSYADVDTLTDELAVELLERITIYPDGRIGIRLAYADELAELRKRHRTDLT